MWTDLLKLHILFWPPQTCWLVLVPVWVESSSSGPRTFSYQRISISHLGLSVWVMENTNLAPLSLLKSEL